MASEVVLRWPETQALRSISLNPYRQWLFISAWHGWWSVLFAFVMGDSYRGPDRRRQITKTSYDGEDRRGDAIDIEENPDVSLSKEEIKVLMA